MKQNGGRRNTGKEASRLRNDISIPVEEGMSFAALEVKPELWKVLRASARPISHIAAFDDLPLGKYCRKLLQKTSGSLL